MVQSSYSTPSNLLKEAIIHTKTYTLFLKAKNYPDEQKGDFGNADDSLSLDLEAGYICVPI